MAALAPPRPSSTALTDSQWATFYAFTEVVVPVLQPAALSADTSAQALSNYAASSASASSHAFRNGVEKLFECQIPAHSRASISTLLNLLK